MLVNVYLPGRIPSGGGSTQGNWLSRVARTVDAGQFKYPRFGPAVPAYGFVHIHAYFGEPTEYLNALGNVTAHFEHRPSTPEELTAQAWLAMNCGVQGIVFSEMKFALTSIGVMHDKPPYRHDQEYDTLAPDGWRATDPQWQLPRMWVGFKSRYNAVKRVTGALRRIDSIVGWRKLIYRKEQISVHDTLTGFTTIPMLDSLRAERAHLTASPFTGTDTFDLCGSIYFEATHYRPDITDSLGSSTYSRYLLLTNRRCWPIDTFHYSNGTTGLGNIDVRRPWVEIKNSTGVMADSFLVERLDTTWTQTIGVDTLTPLDWVTPGWGSFYRLRPKPSGVGYSGTAYNNAVHSENPSTDAIQRDRLTVYMRDSIVYLRATDSIGTWSREWMISDAADSVSSSGSRVAHNMHPALATTRNDSALVIVWERRKGDTATIEMAHFHGLPKRTNFPTPTRRRLSVPRVLNASWMLMTPSITGVDFGWVAAWGSPSNGIEVVGIRNVAVPGANDVSNISVAKAQTIYAYNNFSYPIGGAALYPSLAYVRDSLPAFDYYQAVHLAWQQGMANSANSQFILYQRLRVQIPSTGKPTVTPAGPTEHVSYGLPGCGFLHPSIAVDSVWIAVAFQQNLWQERYVVLRFSDTSGAKRSAWTAL